ncbi:MAG TPA: NAD(+)/NADH kinase [Vicinamibacterales bacterium]|nr:NAD(+)/NADH kinase [Vicinamibacterales bacterium]
MIARAGIVAKRGLTAAAPHLKHLVRWLADRQVEPVVDTETAALLGDDAKGLRTASREELPRLVDLVAVLGGDGTLLSVADRIGAAGCSTPILGINFGRIGFLTEVTLPEMVPALESALAGRAVVHERVMLDGVLRRDDETLARHVVLNDVVITRGLISRLIYLAVHIDGQFITNVRADGLIVASPTGSTAYNLAAGGPIVHPDVDALVLTPIAPHSFANRPIVVPGRSTITIRSAAGGTTTGEVFVSFDGQTGVPMDPRDELVVTRADRPLRLLGSPTRGYYDTLREKLRWGER